MNIIEAVKSGKPFKRPWMPFFREVTYDQGIIKYLPPPFGDRDYCEFRKQDILAEDWIVKED